MTDDANTEDVLCFPRHAQHCGYCIRRGTKPWIEAHGLDWPTFVRQGYPASVLLSFNDGFANNVVAAARKESEA